MMTAASNILLVYFPFPTINCNLDRPSSPRANVNVIGSESSLGWLAAATTKSGRNGTAAGVFGKSVFIGRLVRYSHQRLTWSARTSRALSADILPLPGTFPLCLSLICMAWVFFESDTAWPILPRRCFERFGRVHIESKKAADFAGFGIFSSSVVFASEFASYPQPHFVALDQKRAR